MAKKKTKEQFIREQMRKRGRHKRTRAQAEATWRMMQAQKKALKEYYALNANPLQRYGSWQPRMGAWLISANSPSRQKREALAYAQRHNLRVEEKATAGGSAYYIYDTRRIARPNPTAVTYGETSIETWFERDRAHVALINDRTGDTIIEWWDDDVREAIEDGFLDPRDYHGSAYETAQHLGVLSTGSRMRKNAATYSFGDLPPKRVFMKAYAAAFPEGIDGTYHMLLRGREEHDAVDGTVFEEAIDREAGFDADETWEGVKQLTRKWDHQGDEEAGILVSAILSTLDIEWI